MLGDASNADLPKRIRYWFLNDRILATADMTEYGSASAPNKCKNL